MELRCLYQCDVHYPPDLIHLLGNSAPSKIVALGDLDILQHSKLALLGSRACPGEMILKTYDLVQRLRDEGRCVVGGFHSPIEKECLRILLRGKQPIIICPARSLKGMRLPPEWKQGVEHGRLLILSPFSENLRRPTKEVAQQRNEFVVALADEVFIPHIAPGGQMARLLQDIIARRIPLLKLE